MIDGILYTMNVPTSAHQMIGGLIYTKLMNYVMQKKGKCLPMISPIDVQLDCDDKTMVQPDVVIVCDRDKVIMRCVYGARIVSLILMKFMNMFSFCMIMNKEIYECDGSNCF